MSELIRSFSYEQQTVRTIFRDSEVWFAGKDVALALQHRNPERAVRDYVDEDDRWVTESVTQAGRRKTIFINEPGVYSLILASRTEGARKFKHWVTHDVLPAIRKQGFYASIPDVDLVRLYKERKAANPSLLVDVHADNLRQKRENRVQRQEESDLLYSQKETLTLNEYIPKLRAIWREDMVGFHKAYDLYMNWWKRDGCRQEAYDDV